jgi:ADP-ribose pyrophosphatase YjhB (NUDIX family)
VSRSVRISAKAIVVVDGRILLLRHCDADGDWYSLPGGGQRHGETLPEAVERECMEETGLRVKMGRLVFIRDYISANHEFAQEDPGAHQVELMFECSPAGGDRPASGGRPGVSLGESPDDMQTGVEWVDLSSLNELRLYPRTVAAALVNGVPSQGPVYLGDVN